ETTGLFRPALLERLRGLRFGGAVRALPEGTPFFPDEPLVEVTGPIVETQLVESLLLNRLHLQTILASKAARCVDAARGRTLVDFALRRAHGTDAALAVARASWIAGVDATSNVLAGERYGIPLAGTMAHSFVQALGDELEAFRTFARSFPGRPVLLVDTYDTVTGVERAIAAARGNLGGVRLDSGDLLDLSRRARALLD